MPVHEPIPEPHDPLGMAGIDRDPIRPMGRGALTQIYLGGVTFELVKSHRSP